MPTVCADVEILGGKPGGKPLLQPREVRIIGAEYKHEIAVLTYAWDAALKARCERGLPVRITWGWGTERSEMYAAVHHVVIDREELRRDSTRLMRVVCIGASDALNPPAARQYSSIRVDALVSDVVRAMGFSALVEKHTFAWPLLQQTHESTWSFLVACARKVGYTLYARNTDVRCHSRAIRYSGALAFRDYGPMAAEQLHGAIHAFHLVQAETLASNERKRRRIALGVDDQQNIFSSVVDLPRDQSGAATTPAVADDYHLTSARSIAEADAEMAGDQELNRHYITARATVSGHAYLHPSRPVRLAGIDAQNNGVWYTTRAEHIIDATTYRVNLELGRDGLGEQAVARTVLGEPRSIAARPIVHGGMSARVPASSINQAAPATRWDAIEKRWRASATTERFLPAPNRLPPERIELTYA